MVKKKQPPKQPTLKQAAQHYQAAYQAFMLALYQRALTELKKSEQQ